MNITSIARKRPRAVATAAAVVALFGVSACTNEVDGVATHEVTPQACLDALAAADQVHSLAADAFDVVSRALDAAANFDIAGINAASDDLDALNGPTSEAADDYRAARDECRQAGGRL